MSDIAITPPASTIVDERRKPDGMCASGQHPIDAPGKARLCRKCWRAYMRRYRSVRSFTDAQFRRQMSAASQRRRNRRNRRLRERATNAGKPWTPAEHAVLLRPELSHAAAAVILERSHQAVMHERLRLGRRLLLAEPIRAQAAFRRRHFPDSM